MFQNQFEKVVSWDSDEFSLENLHWSNNLHVRKIWYEPGWILANSASIHYQSIVSWNALVIPSISLLKNSKNLKSGLESCLKFDYASAISWKWSGSSIIRGCISPVIGLDRISHNQIVKLLCKLCSKFYNHIYQISRIHSQNINTLLENLWTPSSGCVYSSPTSITRSRFGCQVRWVRRGGVKLAPYFFDWVGPYLIS